MKILFALSLVLFFGMVLAPRPIQAAPDTAYVVNYAGDNDDGLCDASECNLREAINAANAHEGLDTITFDIGGCPCTIYPQSALPEITDPVIINGYTESGATPADNGNSAVMKIILRGFDAPSFANGLHISGGSSTVKGLTLNGWGGAAIWLSGGSNNVIEGNFIGTYVNGLGASPNGRGILISHSSSYNTIGGNLWATKNIIAGNTNAGIEIADTGGSAQANSILNNHIGLGADSAPLGNGVGIVIHTPNNVIGNPASPHIDTNSISGNDGAGIELSGANAYGNLIVGNLIGWMNPAVEGNGTYGILIHNGASKNKIGTPTIFNFIANNGADGVAIVGYDSQRNAVRGNYMAFNGGLGIDLDDDGITTNDALDADNGPNTRLNFPVITSVNAATNRVKGKLNAAPNSKYKIDLYYTGICAPLGYGEGVYLQTVQVTTDANGLAKFSVIAKQDIEPTYSVTGITATKRGNTSEFSKCKLAQ